MMIAYNRGDLFDAIITGLASSPDIVKEFQEKLHITTSGEKKITLILDNILTIFKHIRGCWFIKKITGQKRHNSSHSTRKNVQVKTEIASAKAEVRCEATMQSFYSSAELNIKKNNIDLYKLVDENE